MTASSGTSAPVAAAPAPAVSFCARRGGQWMTEEALRAHLAALLRLENVGVLLGSGASSGVLGGKSMTEVWADFTASFAKDAAWLQEQKFVSQAGKPNVEELADVVEIAFREWTRSGNAELPKLTSARRNLQRSVLKGAVLKPELWVDSAAVDQDLPELAAHRKLLHKLTAARQPGQPAPWIFTTNYDMAVEWAAESIGLKVTNGFDGLHRRTFSPHNFDLGYRNVLARGEARFGTYNAYLAKLHGSLSWYRKGIAELLESPCASRWPVIKDVLAGTTEDADLAIILPSAAKYIQTVGFVLGELLRRFTEFLARPQASLLVSGFSFSDEHLNRILVSALQNPTLQVVVCVPELKRAQESLDVSACGPWLQRLAKGESPQVTLVGGGPDAWFAQLVDRLPDPAIYDEQAARIREMMRDFESIGKEKPAGVV